MESLGSLGAGLEAVEVLEITVAGRAIVKITSDAGLSCVGGLRFSLERTRPNISPPPPPLAALPLLLPLPAWTLPQLPFSYQTKSKNIIWTNEADVNLMLF